MADPTARDLIQRLADDLQEARDAVADWASYASEHFQRKHDLQGELDRMNAQIERARAYLATPEPAAGPSESDVSEMFYRHVGEGSEVGFENAIAEALSRWGHQPPQPIPLSERLPGPEDCDAEERCWLLHVTGLGLKEWCFLDRYPSIESYSFYGYTHWLPHHALPLPEAP